MTGPGMGGKREGAGRVPGVSPKSHMAFRALCRDKYSEAASEMIFDLMQNSPEDKWLQFRCAKELLDRCWGRPKEHLTVDPIDTSSPGVYHTLEEVRQRLIERGLPVDHMEAPRLIGHEPEESES